MKILLKTLFLALTLTFFSCSNGSDSEPCIPITCLNGGISNIDCGCDCPIGYTGVNCSEQVTPSKITITKFTVKVFPITQTNGDNWDSWLTNSDDAFPDIYITLSDSNSNIIWDSPTYFPNAGLILDVFEDLLYSIT
jgi:hypothetical protein